MRKLFAYILPFLSFPCCQAQEVSVEADLTSQYVWRGLELGSVSLQPTFGIDWKGLSFSAWGNAGLSDRDDPREIDLTLSYSRWGFTVGVTDYWATTRDEDAKYFRYDGHHTNHVFEANLSYDFNELKACPLPLSLSWNTNFAGGDGVTKRGKRAFSSYVELASDFSWVDCDWTARAGIVPYAAEYYETGGFALTLLSVRATRDIRINDKFSIPVFAEGIANTRSGKAWLAFGFTLRP